MEMCKKFYTLFGSYFKSNVSILRAIKIELNSKQIQVFVSVCGGVI